MEVKTDNKWKSFKYRNEVPAKVLKSEFDYLSEDDSDGFFQYRGVWYHLSGFMRVNSNSPFPKPWIGYAGDSFFSGVLIQVSDDGEQYRVGTYFS